MHDALPPDGEPMLGELFDTFLRDRRPAIWMGKGPIGQAFWEYRIALFGFLNCTPGVTADNWRWGFYTYRSLQCPHTLRSCIRIDILRNAVREDLEEFLRLRGSAGQFPLMSGDGDGI